MILVIGCLLGAGLLLVAAPLLWPRADQAAERSPARGRLRGILAQAGLGSLPLAAFVAISLVLGLAVAALAQAILGIAALSVVAGLSGLALPLVTASRRARARLRANRAVWPDVVDHLVSAVRSGLALPDSVGSLAGAGPLSTRSSFAAFAREYRASGNFSAAVDELKASLADPVADRILETLRMAREVGGSDLTVVLRSLAAWLRQDSAIRSEIEARQSWIVSAARLGVAAPWIILLLLASRPEAAIAYNTASGVVVIVGGLVVSVVAYQVMVALGRLPEERRWFR
ncbi:type II secretion system protein F [Cryobacterium sp. TMT1-21]|uniref:Type II secretion system protein F n=1 Tax=Cryobacterium shii TaxID=1259235 RepID=A0AAQ2HH13_9MICO|nr:MULTISPECIES: type II secretion system F family protein [Cryobacterium]TFC53239.1 type II secretion system protein F [Cryobacterium shii]TFC83195.1 type II secretion system protein F [Cryobacterium sp. TmT2-59]TFD17956.1 type II secretion system protein F [Cryobacterium sp. TMT4-10]TFD18157.1 type II secretion system protein F [Cryobacterium sp. TMT1-21]TFD24975.1 type II secretion system protein F [Cryobacterium sp. TMT2-23]